MTTLWPFDHPVAGTGRDGTRAEVGICRRCTGRQPDRLGPYTWLQGQMYCELCYPLMVAVLDADVKLARLKS